jgi:anionic cell wall polymer biosynthesis LytR-Cps2A-Psr (LCP) family protein
MIDPAQTILFLVIIILTVLLVVLGIQVFFILRELRKTIDKTNKVLDDTSVITESVSKPLASFSTLAMGLKTGATIAKILQGGKKHHDKKDE